MPDLLEKLLHKAIQNPTAAHLQSIYAIVSGSRHDLLKLVSPDLFIRLQEHLLDILRVLEAEEHSANLLCLAILGKLVSTETTHLKASEQHILSEQIISPGTSPSNEPNRTFPVSCSPAKQFFTAKRACKTLDLVVLKVILACSRGCFLSPSEVIESLQISKEIVDIIGKDETRTWLSKNSSKSRKLYEKILRPDIDVGVRCAVGTSWETGNLG